MTSLRRKKRIAVGGILRANVVVGNGGKVMLGSSLFGQGKTADPSVEE